MPLADYESVLAELEINLRKMRHPHTRHPLVEDILRSSDLYEGPYSKDGPDL